MDLLEVTEIAELLGEPESVIVDACERFPLFVRPSVIGRQRRYPAEVLDILRLITDELGAGATDGAIEAMLRARYPSAPLPPLPTPRVPPQPHNIGAPVTDLVQQSLDRQTASIRDALERQIVAIRGTAETQTAVIRDELLQLRREIALTEQAEALGEFRAEMLAAVRSLAPVDAPQPGSVEEEHIAQLREGLASLQTALAEIGADLARVHDQLDRLNRREALAEVRNEPRQIQSRIGDPKPEELRPERPPAPQGTNGSIVEALEDEPAGDIVKRLATRTPHRTERSALGDDA